MPARRNLTRDQWIASLQWNMNDAMQALQNAVQMGAWANARKYIGQLEKLERQLYDASRERLPARLRR